MKTEVKIFSQIEQLDFVWEFGGGRVGFWKKGRSKWNKLNTLGGEGFGG